MGRLGFHLGQEIHKGHAAFVGDFAEHGVALNWTSGRGGGPVGLPFHLLGGEGKDDLFGGHPERNRLGAAHKDRAGGKERMLGVASVNRAYRLVRAARHVLFEDFPAGQLGIHGCS